MVLAVVEIHYVSLDKWSLKVLNEAHAFRWDPGQVRSVDIQAPPTSEATAVEVEDPLGETPNEDQAWPTEEETWDQTSL